MPALRGILRVGRDVLIIVLITVALGELGLRIYNSIDPLPIFYSESYNRFRGKPFAPDYNTFYLNSRGFKDVEFSTRKATGSIRILGIGDSFAFGTVPYEYNYLTLVEQNLKQDGHNVELINMGIPSIGPREYVSLLVHEGFALEPDRVLLSFSISDDFRGQQRSSISYSYVASLIKYVLNHWKKYEGRIIHGGGGAYDDNAPHFTDDFYLKLETRRSTIFLRDNRAFEDEFATALSYISEIKRLCDSRNIGLTIVLIPDEVQVSKPLQTRVIAASGLAQASLKFPLPPASFDFTLPNRLLHARFEELKIDYIDLTAEFSAHSLNDRLYLPNNSHWNIAGNELAARLILQHLSAQLGPSEASGQQ
jgi:SGNH hydrolase-like domain, acetyltransferase AlgX